MQITRPSAECPSMVLDSYTKVSEAAQCAVCEEIILVIATVSVATLSEAAVSEAQWLSASSVPSLEAEGTMNPPHG